MGTRGFVIPTVVVAALVGAGLAGWVARTGRAQAPPAAPSKVLPTPVPPPQACVHPPHDRLCPDLPHDVIESFLAGYSQLGAAQQRPFDNFAWQMFVALNWPADDQGRPRPGPFHAHPNAPRVWEFYPSPFTLLGRVLPAENSPPRDLLQSAAGGARHVFTMFATRSNPKDRKPGSILQAGSAKPLIDRHLNFVVYDVRVNPTEYDFIRKYRLNTQAGQEAYLKTQGASVAWPLGSYADPQNKTGGAVGAIELKTAWRILDPAREPGAERRYYTVDGVMVVDKEHSQNGQPLTIRAKFGLVGFHIIQRTTGPQNQPQDWIWATFEHVDNAPLAANAREPTDISLPLPTTGTAPDRVDRHYTFFNPAYTGQTNDLPDLPDGQVYQWAPTPPYAAQYALDGQYGTQVVRCWKVYPPTAEVTRYFQRLLRGTVWANYELIGSQWQGGVENPQLENGNIPRYLANTTLETYVQLQSFGSCLACHSSSPTLVNGLSGNFSHLLLRGE